MKMMKSALAAILVALGIAACNQSIDEVKGPTFPHVHRGNEPEKANGGPVRTSIDTDLMARRKIVFEASLNEFTDLKGKIVSSEELASWIISDSLTQDEFECLLRLPLERHLAIMQAGATQLDVPLDKIEIALKELKRIASDGHRDHNEFILGSCHQYIEYSNSSGLSGCWNWWFDSLCDDDPNDGEYVFAAYPSWRDDADHVRWYTYNPWIRFVFWRAYHNALLGVDACAPEIRLCIGDAGVWAAGGPLYVSLYLFVGHI
jgi:hypothetical protein